MFSDLSCLYLSTLTTVQSRLCWQLSSCSPSLLLLHFHNATRSWPHGELWARAPYDIDLAEAEGGTQGRRSPREAWLQFNHWMFEGSSLSCDTFMHEVPSFSSAHPFYRVGQSTEPRMGARRHGQLRGISSSARSHQQLPLQPQHPRGTALHFLDHARMQENISVLLFLMLNGCAQS